MSSCMQATVLNRHASTLYYFYLILNDVNDFIDLSPNGEISDLLLMTLHS